ncbi:MAG: SusC/RagA family TonB-linked outer membrane protein, partial [Bacteroidales bacterium]|nr:SusC/RagA family TonB-linked outer membrane protein [Bacteroidales bacterium]
MFLIFGSLKVSADDPARIAELQQQTVSGVVSDENGAPMPGVNVQVQGTTIGVITDMNGRYSLNVTNPNQDVLVFSFVGYNRQDVPVTGRTSVNVSLEPSLSALEEVIVIGYGTTRKADLTGSITALDDEQYRAQPVTRVDDILQGRSAGVNVTTVSGAPGGTTSIRIRGSNSITGSNEPLYVIDGFVGGDMSTVNPTDIESIQVLKDASSTAIYGSRGANGVVLITTKGGTAGQSKISISTRYYLSNPIGKWPLLNANEFVTVVNERADALGYAHPYTDEEVNYWKTHEGTDWQDEIYRTAGGEEVQLDYSGGSDKITYFVSGNFLNQDGIIINSDLKRYSLRTNVNAKLSDKLNGSLKVNFNRRETNNVSGAFSTLGVVGTATAWAPTTPVYDEFGQFTAFDPISSIKTNPVELAMNDGINEISSFSTNGNFVYKIIQGLTFDVGFGVNYTNTQGKNFSLNAQTKQPSATRSSRELLFLQNTNNLTYTRTFNNIHNLTVTGVAEYQWQSADYFTITSNELLFPVLKYDNLSLAKSYSTSNSLAKSTIGSYIGRVNYSLMDKYLVTLSVRNDRSSKFRGKNQKSFFPSIGLGWRISQENFMTNLDFISNLKLRASWGETGSQAINVYGTVTS